MENIPDTSDIINDVNKYDDTTNITDLYNNITDNDDLLTINAFDIRETTPSAVEKIVKRMQLCIT